MSNPRPLILEEPLAIDEARAASRAIANQRRSVEKLHEEQVTDAAEKAREAKKAWAEAFIRSEGTAALRKALADQAAATAEYEADVATGLVKVYVEKLRGLEGERSMLKSLIDWSARLNLDGRERIQQ